MHLLSKWQFRFSQFVCRISSKLLIVCIDFFYDPWKTKTNFIFLSYFHVLLPTVCEETYSPKSYRYHPGLWSGKKWSCCKTVNRTAFGCQAATLWTETNNNPSPRKFAFDFLSFQISKILYSIVNALHLLCDAWRKKCDITC